MIGTGVAVAVTTAVLAIALYAQSGRGVMSVNGSKVFQEEFTMLLKDNSLGYEQALRSELAVPEEQTLLEFLDGDLRRYQSLLLEKNIRHLTQLRVQQNLAAVM